MRKKYLSIIPILILTACSTTQNQKNLKPQKEVVKSKIYSCSDIDSIIDNHKFDVEPLTNLYKKCPNKKTEVALLIAKGDDYGKKGDNNRAFINYKKALSTIDKNQLEIFDEYRFYLKNRIKSYTPKAKSITKNITQSSNSGVIDSQALEGYIKSREKTRGADFEEFNRVKGIPLNFATGSSTIEGGNLAQAKEIGKLLSKKDYKDRIIYITGYTDTRGDNTSNQILSVQRADGLKSYLLENFSLKEDNIRAEGYGESFPICLFGDKQKSGNEYSCSGQENYDRSRRVTLEYGE